MRRTKALILVATLAVLTSVAACSWQAEPLPAESAQSESSLNTSEFATQETAEKEQQIPDLSGVPEPSPEPLHFLNRLLHRNQNLPRVRLPNRRLRRLPNLRQRPLSGVMLPLQPGVKLRHDYL